MQLSMKEICARLDGWIDHLPPTLASVVSREFDPVKNLLLLQRAVRVLVVTDRLGPWAQFLSEMTFQSVAPSSTRGRRGARWRRLPGSVPGMEFAIVTVEQEEKTAGEFLGEASPDLILLLAAPHSDVRAMVTRLADLLAELREDSEHPPVAVVGVFAGEGCVTEPISVAVSEEPRVARRFAGLHTVEFGSRLTQEGTLASGALRDPSMDLLLDTCFGEIPLPARMAFVRATRHRKGQREVAAGLSRSAAAVAGVIGAQPIPLADLPLLTGLQVALIAAIAYTGGRTMNVRLGLEFTAAVGLNVAAAMALRGGARTITKLLPGWGHLAAGALAAGGTVAVGRAAEAFFLTEPLPPMRRE